MAMTELIIHPDAQATYSRVVSRAANESVKEQIQFLFEVQAFADDNFELIDEEAKKVEALLEKHDQTPSGRSFSCFGPQVIYDQSEVNDALLESFGSDPSQWNLNDEDIFVSKAHHITDPFYRGWFMSRIRQDYVWTVTCFLLGEKSEQFLDVLDQMTKLPNIGERDLATYLSDITELMYAGFLFDLTTGNIKEHFQFPGFDINAYFDEYISFVLLNAQESYDRYEFNLKLKEVMEANSDNPFYLTDVVENETNPYAKAFAIKKLGKMETGADSIRVAAQDPNKSILVLTEVYEAHRRFDNEDSVRWLFNQFNNEGFTEHLMAAKALSSHVNPEAVAEIALETLASDDAHERARAALILRYAYSRIDSPSASEKIDRALSGKALDPHEEHLVRLAAIESLQFTPNKGVRSQLKPLLSSPDSGIRDLASQTIAALNKEDTEQAQFPTVFPTFQSNFFRNPVQFSWISEVLKEDAQYWSEGQPPLSVLVVGGSYGAEAMSILLTVLSDYDSDPESWGEFNPHKDLKIIHTDISLEAVIFADKAAFEATTHDPLNSAEKIRLHALRSGRDQDHYDKYFIHESGKIKLKPEYAGLIETQYLDITLVENFSSTYLPATVTVYNQVDPYLDSEAQPVAAQNVLDLSGRYVATAPSSHATTAVFNSQAFLRSKASILHLYEKYPTVPNK